MARAAGLCFTPMAENLRVGRSPRVSIIGGSQRAADRQQLNLGTIGDQLLGCIENVDEVCAVGTHRGYSNRRPSVQLEMINFGDAELEAPTQFRDQRAYQGALFLQRMHIAEQQVELQRAHPHGHGAQRRHGLTWGSLSFWSSVKSDSSRCGDRARGKEWGTT
jgi:hypothetical protein